MSKRKPRVVVTKTVSKEPVASFETNELVPAWALGRTAAKHRLSERERKLTAAIYVRLPGVLDHVRQQGRLPANMGPAGGAELGLRVLVQRRGVDIDLTENERLVHEVLLRHGEVPAGCAVLLGPRPRARRGRRMTN